MQRIDAHHHFWRLDRGDYGWLNADNAALAPIRRDVGPADLAPLLKKHHISQTVLVQAAPSEAETDYMLQLAAQNPFIGGVVGWTDISNPASIATLERWAAEPAFRGIRPMLQDMPDDNWIAEAPHPDVMAAIHRLGICFDALVKPQQLEALVTFAKRYPNLPIVIDHAAKPDFATGWPNAWAGKWMRGLILLAQMPQVMVKFSGLLTEMTAAQRGDPVEYIAPVAEFLGEIYGPKRLIWGSDWPVLTLAASYDSWVDISDRFIRHLDTDDQKAIWHDNALAFYGLAERAAA